MKVSSKHDLISRDVWLISLGMALLFQLGCVSVQKRPRKLLQKAVVENKQFDAIIVPGVPFNGAWYTTMKGRVLWSAYLYKHGLAKNVIYSGSAVYSPYYEAKIMALYAQELGVQPQHIFVDTLAEHSTENVYYSYLLARNLGFKSIALATDPFQSAMLKRFTRKRFSTPVIHLPIVYDTLIQYPYIDITIEPKTASAPDSFTSITSREGFWQRFKGTLGRNIPWQKHAGRKVEAL